MDEAVQTEEESPPDRHKLRTRAGTLEYTLSGHGPATIVLLNGAGVTLEGWSALYPQIESIGRVFAWNRFGLAGSDEPPPVHDAAVVVASLRELLAHAGLEPPYVLVGHSLGGLYANLFARRHPGEVAGVLFLEASHPRDHESLPAREDQLSRGLAKLFSEPPSGFEANLHAEIESAADSAQEVESAGGFPAVPIAVVTGGMDPPKALLSPQEVASRRARQQALARLSPDAEHVIAARSGHFPQRSEPQLVLAVLRRLVQRTRQAAAPKKSLHEGG